MVAAVSLFIDFVNSKDNFESFENLMEQFQFDWEVHSVTTDDGYILNMFRLVGPKANASLYSSDQNASRNRNRAAVSNSDLYFYPERMQKKDEQRKLAEERLFMQEFPSDPVVISD